MVIRNHPVPPNKRKWDIQCRLQMLLLPCDRFPGFIQVLLEKHNGKWTTDNYIMVGCPNGGGIWTEF